MNFNNYLLDFELTDLISALRSVVSFLLSMMTEVADFFTTSLLGQLILGCALAGVVVNIVNHFLNKIH